MIQINYEAGIQHKGVKDKPGNNKYYPCNGYSKFNEYDTNVQIFFNK